MNRAKMLYTIQKNHPLDRYNTFGVSACVERFVAFERKEALRAIFRDPLITSAPVYLLGGGSNMLFASNFLVGTVLHPLQCRIEVQKETVHHVFVRATAGVVWDDFVLFCVRHGWWGVENLSLIPGTVGASPVQNIGAYSVEAKDVIHAVEIYNIPADRFEILTPRECLFGYRDSVFKHQLKGQAVVVGVTYRLAKNGQPNLCYARLCDEVAGRGVATLENIRAAIVSIRRQKLPDPDQLGNGGSFFKNPIVSQQQAEALACRFPDIVCFPALDGVKISAAWMIDRAGWKGFRQGDAGVHDKQALVLVNHGTASGEELLMLSQRIVADVWQKFGVEITPEINIL